MNRSIGVLDSGIGGLTVVKELQRQLPGEDIIYFGDNRNCTHIDNMSAKGDLYNLVLACTHFPIVENLFLDLGPGLNIINPAFQQAKAIRQYLYKNDL